MAASNKVTTLAPLDAGFLDDGTPMLFVRSGQKVILPMQYIGDDGLPESLADVAVTIEMEEYSAGVRVSGGTPSFATAPVRKSGDTVTTLTVTKRTQTGNDVGWFDVTWPEYTGDIDPAADTIPVFLIYITTGTPLSSPTRENINLMWVAVRRGIATNA